MKPYTVQQLADAMSGTLPQGGGHYVVDAGVSTDTRSIAHGALFVALKGDNFDAHDFLDQAAAAAALVIEDASKFPDGQPVILVEDTLTALQDLASWYRSELDVPVIAISGSNGKTSTKDFTRAVLSQKFRVNATLGNLNNHIGLPLTVLATQGDHETAVFEMGMNHSGELAPLCRIGRPDISIITNVGSAHIENMGSIEAIAEEKAELARALTSEGTLFLPADCEYLDLISNQCAGRVIPVGGANSLVRAENTVSRSNGSTFDLVIEDLGRIETSISVAGSHMVSNALLAAGAAWLLGLTLEEISRGLSGAELTSGRLRQFDVNGITIIDDTYNANPESVIAGLQTLANLPSEGTRTAALGILAEQGDHAGEAYERIGKVAAELGLRLVSVGEEAAAMAAPHHFPQPHEAAEWLSANTHKGDLILFKGSRAAAMEKVMNEAFPQSN